MLGQPFLHLQPARKHIDNARDFAEPDNLAIRDVGDMGAADERQQMMLAQAVILDIVDDDHIGVFDMEDGVVDQLDGVGRIAADQLSPGFGDARWRFQQAFAVGLLADGIQQVENGALYSGLIDCLAEYAVSLLEVGGFQQLLDSIVFRAYHLRFMAGNCFSQSVSTVRHCFILFGV